jgi:hypothetical protein
MMNRGVSCITADKNNATQITCKTNYVYLEMILNKDSKYDVVAGLFKGIIEKDDDKFILLHGLKDSTNVLNLKFYNIMMIEELEADYKNMIYLNSEAIDQKIALEEVEKLYDRMILAKMGIENDPRIIDVKKLVNVPKEYIEGKPLEKEATTHTATANGVGSFVNPVTRYAGSSGVYTKTVVKAEPEPAVLSRSNNKKPLKAALDLMEEKINQIMAGDFKPILPETMGEDADGTGISEEIEDETYYRAGMGFC